MGDYTAPQLVILALLGLVIWKIIKISATMLLIGIQKKLKRGITTGLSALIRSKGKYKFNLEKKLSRRMHEDSKYVILMCLHDATIKLGNFGNPLALTKEERQKMVENAIIENSQKERIDLKVTAYDNLGNILGLKRIGLVLPVAEQLPMVGFSLVNVDDIDKISSIQVESDKEITYDFRFNTYVSKTKNT